MLSHQLDRVSFWHTFHLRTRPDHILLSRPTTFSQFLRLQDPSFDPPELLHKVCRSSDREALNLLKGWSGYRASKHSSPDDRHGKWGAVTVVAGFTTTHASHIHRMTVNFLATSLHNYTARRRCVCGRVVKVNCPYTSASSLDVLAQIWQQQQQ